MTAINGTITDTAGKPINGVLLARTTIFRPDGVAVLAPETVPYPITAGHVAADLAPGPARLGVQADGPPNYFNVTIPETGPVTLASLIGDQ